MDERHLKYLYAVLAVLFGLPSLFAGGVGACIALVMGAIGLVSLDAGELWFAAVMCVWGTAALAGLVAWVALSVIWLRDGLQGLRVASPRWWWLLGLGVLCVLVFFSVFIGFMARFRWGTLARPPPLQGSAT